MKVEQTMHENNWKPIEGHLYISIKLGSKIGYRDW